MGNPRRQWTILALIDWTRGYLARAGVEEARLSAEVLLARVLGCRRVQLYTQYGRAVAPEHLAAYRELVRRAGTGEPIAYLTGEKEFYSLALRVTPDVLIPRPETELLVDVALELARAASGPLRMWDCCTGSGCVAVAAAHYAAGLSVLATDVSAPAVEVARQNVQRHGLSDRVRLACADLLELPQEAAGMVPFDLIAANPPYVSDGQMAGLPQAVRREPALALRAGPTGLECIQRLVRDAPARLGGDGVLAFEIGMGQAEKTYELLSAAGCYQEIRFLKDAAGIERAAVARKASQ